MGVWACALFLCVSGTVWGSVSLIKNDAEKDKVCVHVYVCLTKCLWICVCMCGCVHCWVCVCAVLIASGDCQVGYRETVMTALLLPGWPPTRCTRLAVTAMMCIAVTLLKEVMSSVRGANSSYHQCSSCRPLSAAEALWFVYQRTPTSTSSQQYMPAALLHFSCSGGLKPN